MQGDLSIEEVARIAEGLSDYIRSAVLSLSREWYEKDIRELRMDELRSAGLFESTATGNRCRHKFRLNANGIQVRDYLANREGAPHLAPPISRVSE